MALHSGRRMRAMRAVPVALVAIGAALTFGVVARSAAAPAPSFAKTVWYRTSPNPSSVVIQDLNGDGKPDLAIVNSWNDWQRLAGDHWEGMGTVSVRLSRGDGTFQPRRDYNAGSGSTALATGDLNGDGVPDLVTANAGGEDDAGTVSVLLGRGDGSFPSRHDYPAGDEPDSVAVGDVNGDHKPDVVSNGGSTVSVFLNTGDGGLAPKVDYRDGGGGSPVRLVDVDGDGHLDVVTAGGRTVSVLRNVGDGTFGPPKKYDSGADTISVAGADLNGDGKPDLVVSHQERPSVSVLLNAGDGTFTARRDYRTGSAFQPTIAMADMNGDGYPDLVTPGELGISLLLNAGDGTFELPLAYRGGSENGAVAVGDLNGDGRPDIAATASIDPEEDESPGALELSVLIDRPGVCNVQPLSRLTLTAAKGRLARANCSVGKVTRKYSKTVKQGLVSSQSPAFGAVLPGGGKVSLVISRGKR
jgi:FG-GAP-like repeat/PASTA domain